MLKFDMIFINFFISDQLHGSQHEPGQIFGFRRSN